MTAFFFLGAVKSFLSGKLLLIPALEGVIFTFEFGVFKLFIEEFVQRHLRYLL